MQAAILLSALSAFSLASCSSAGTAQTSIDYTRVETPKMSINGVDDSLRDISQVRYANEATVSDHASQNAFDGAATTAEYCYAPVYENQKNSTDYQRVPKADSYSISVDLPASSYELSVDLCASLDRNVNAKRKEWYIPAPNYVIIEKVQLSDNKSFSIPDYETDVDFDCFIFRVGLSSESVGFAIYYFYAEK